MRNNRNFIGFFLCLFIINVAFSQKSDVVKENEIKCEVIGDSLIGEYKGKCKKGLANGKGVFVFSESQLVYEGSFRKGKMNGKGIIYTLESGKKEIYKKGIWENNIYIGEKRISPYEINRRLNVERFSVRKIDEGSEISLNFFQNGSRNNVNNLRVNINNGTSVVGSNVYKINNVIFPFECEVIYNSPNKFNTTTFEVRFEITINEPGEWEISLYN